ncbi:MAG: hypothetical protein H6565_03930 [Lewinellaceae bacterium]|nr:hypothetical protein [Lewinellaceae bacterium]
MRSVFLSLFSGLALPLYLSAQSTSVAEASIFSTLQQYDPLEVLIETDLKRLKKDRGEEQWQAGVFKVMYGDSVALQLDIQLAARGNMRKKTCHFPPVKIRFYSKTPENDSIADINELKLVTSCKNTNLDEEWVQKECLTYELYNLITDQSFQVKRASIRFSMPGRKSSMLNSFSFFIESEKEMAARLNARPIKPRIVSYQSMDSMAYDRMAMFQYMIGNTDWSIRVRHNIKVLYIMPNGPTIPIPYDFDYAGLVGTDYAVPDPKLPILNVRERVYMGQCRDEVTYQEIYRLFRFKKADILAHCRDFAELRNGIKKEIGNYLDEFFYVLEHPDIAKMRIENECGKIK